MYYIMARKLYCHFNLNVSDFIYLKFSDLLEYLMQVYLNITLKLISHSLTYLNASDLFECKTKQSPNIII